MNTDKQLIQQQIEATFKRRVEALYITPKTVKFLREQAAFFAGAMAALQSVFGEQTDSGPLTDMVPVTWTLDIMRNVNIVRDKPAPAAQDGRRRRSDSQQEQSELLRSGPGAGERAEPRGAVQVAKK